jgi:hypothetical protein
MKMYMKNRPGASSCSLCSPGEYNSAYRQKDCLICGVGSYTGVYNATICSHCSVGRHQGLTQQSTCDACERGKAIDVDGIDYCLSCGVGKFANGTGSASCRECLPGYYQSSQGGSSCDACARAKYSGKSGQKVCASCPVGTFGNVTRQSACYSCPGGTYNPNEGQSTCKLCAAGSYSIGSADVCTECGDGTAQPDTGKSICKTCDTHSTSNFLRTACDCVAGYYLPNYVEGSGEYNCAPCPDGADCTQPGSTWINLKAQSGYWRSSNSSENFYRCLLSWQCTGGQATTGATGCADNRGGIMCAKCLPGYREETGGQCIACPEGGTSYFYMVLIGLAVVFLIWLQCYVVLQSGQKAQRKQILQALQGEKHDPEQRRAHFTIRHHEDSDVSESEHSGDDRINPLDHPDDEDSDDDNDGDDGDDSGDGEGDEDDEESSVDNAIAAPVAQPTGQHRHMQHLDTADPYNGSIIYHPSPPAPNFMYKLKIFLGFVQVYL